MNELGYMKFYKRNRNIIPIEISQKIAILKSLSVECKNVYSFLQKLSELEILVLENDYNNCDSNLLLSTFHSAKGQEFDNVILLDLIDGILPEQRGSEPVDDERIENDARLFYVGVTRAKNKLIFFDSEKQNGEKVSPSRFQLEYLS